MVMKKLIVTLAAVVSAVALNAQESISLADARSSIGDCIKTPSKMTEVMKKLSAEDQKAFLAEVNEAIAAKPGSNEAQAATFLNVNRAALKGAKQGNLNTLVAEVFATVPAEYLPVISERFASDLFSRTADQTVKYSDEEYINIASNLMVNVSARMSNVDGGAARSTFAIVMLAKASNMTGSPTEAGSPLNTLVTSLLGTLPADSPIDTIKNDWIPTALATGESQSYEPIVEGSGTPGTMPSPSVVVQTAGPQVLDNLLSDLNTGSDSVTESNNGERNNPSSQQGNNEQESSVNTVIPETPSGSDYFD